MPLCHSQNFTNNMLCVFKNKYNKRRIFWSITPLEGMWFHTSNVESSKGTMGHSQLPWRKREDERQKAGGDVTANVTLAFLTPFLRSQTSDGVRLSSTSGNLWWLRYWGNPGLQGLRSRSCRVQTLLSQQPCSFDQPMETAKPTFLQGCWPTGTFEMQPWQQ